MFENDDFSALEHKARIRRDRDGLEIHAPMGRHRMLGTILLLVTVPAALVFAHHVSLEWPKVAGDLFGMLILGAIFAVEGVFLLGFGVAALLMFFHHSYSYVTPDGVRAEHRFLFVPYFRNALTAGEIGSLFVECHGSSASNGQVGKKLYRLRAYPKDKARGGKVKVRDIVGIIEGVENDKDLVLGFADWVKAQLQPVPGVRTPDQIPVVFRERPGRAGRARRTIAEGRERDL